jgi:hypothetical protein
MILDNQYGAICMRVPLSSRPWCGCFSRPSFIIIRPALCAREEQGFLPGSLQGQSRSDDYSRAPESQNKSQLHWLSPPQEGFRARSWVHCSALRSLVC